MPHLDGNNISVLQFVDRGHGTDTEGITNQTVLRVLIDRVKFLDNEMPWEGNKTILYHLRMALVLHESRHLFRAVEKGDVHPEYIRLDSKGHFEIRE